MSKNKHYNSEHGNDISDLKDDNKPSSLELFIKQKPEKIWIGMVVIIILSIIGNVLYSVFYTPKEISTEEALRNTEISIDPISEGFGKMVQAGASINNAMSIKKDIDIILNKDTLSHQDSVQLLILFEQLESINKKFIPAQKP